MKRYFGRGKWSEDGQSHEVDVVITYENEGFNPEWLIEQHLDKFFTSNIQRMYKRFAEEVNSRLQKWNDDYEKAHSKEDCWSNKYTNYIFEKYRQIADVLNKTEPNGILEYHPMLVKEDEKRAVYEGQMEPVFGVRFITMPDKLAYLEFFEPEEDEK
jgi:hypothetical protein